MNLRIRRYVVGDAALVRPRQEMIGEVNAIGLEILDCHAPDGDAWTVTLDGMPVACGGLWPIWPGRLCAWTWIGGELSLRLWAQLAQAMRGELDRRLKASPRALRIEATARLPKACAFLERLGFQEEGVMRCYSPGGEHYVLYARIHHP